MDTHGVVCQRRSILRRAMQPLPEIDTLPDDELDRCPWSCAHDRSGHPIIMCLNYGDQLQEAALFVINLAARHDLICFDPQGPNVYLPPGLKPKRSRFQLDRKSTRLNS